MRKLYLFSFLLLCTTLRAQMPDTDIWLFDLEQKGDSFILSKGMNITDRPGYDNQPSFSPDGKFIYYTSYRDGQADIYRYELASNIVKPFCQTPESEYSPTVTPDGKFVSVVRVEKDSAQRLWKFPVAGGPPLLVFKNIDSIVIITGCHRQS
jgi:Tol biopolymer transport system component